MQQRIGLALSGGGFRATCFGLGCLRALHDQNLLRSVTVISAVSGGGLLAALYAYGPERFVEFDDLVVDQLRSGLQAETAARALRPDAIARNLVHAASAALWRRGRAPMSRSANRTDALRDTLAARAFGKRTVTEGTFPDLDVVISATDLRTTNAVRFGNRQSSCSAYGIIDNPIQVAEAVAASAAYPTLLPAMERLYTFRQRPGTRPEPHVVQMVDGGIYDNLGLNVLQPGRSSAYTPHAYDLDYIISCDAGQGQPSPSSGHFILSRLKRSFVVTHRKTQDAARGRLHADQAAGRYRGFVQAYLGMPDSRLPVPVADLVPAQAVSKYPTDFRAMSDEDIVRLALRGEQLTRVLTAHYCPDLLQ
jgi:NTE family protein